MLDLESFKEEIDNHSMRNCQYNSSNRQMEVLVLMGQEQGWLEVGQVTHNTQGGRKKVVRVDILQLQEVGTLRA